MRNYIRLAQRILNEGFDVGTRGVLASTGKHVGARSLIGEQLKFELSLNFPIVTAKKINFLKVATELCWYLRGDTNTAWLHERNVKIWDEWQDENGDLGPIYGEAWRRWKSHDGKEIDQIAILLKNLKSVIEDPNASAGRRLIVSAWNPAHMPEKAPAACQTLVQFFVRGKYLHSHLYQRSCDLFLGLPYNLSAYSLLTCLIAHKVGLRPGSFIHTFGDVHIYENHFGLVDEMIQRPRHELPRLDLSELQASDDLKEIEPKSIKLVGYQSGSFMAGEIAI